MYRVHVAVHRTQMAEVEGEEIGQMVKYVEEGCDEYEMFELAREELWNAPDAEAK